MKLSSKSIARAVKLLDEFLITQHRYRTDKSSGDEPLEQYERVRNEAINRLAQTYEEDELLNKDYIDFAKLFGWYGEVK